MGKESEKEWIYVYVQLNHFAVHLKLTLYCKSTCGILVPHPGIEPVPPALEAQSPNRWTAGEFPGNSFFKFIYLFIYGCVGSSFLCEGFL